MSAAAYFLALLGFLIVWPMLLVVTFYETGVLIFGESPPVEPPDPDDDLRN